MVERPLRVRGSSKQELLAERIDGDRTLTRSGRIGVAFLVLVALLGSRVGVLWAWIARRLSSERAAMAWAAALPAVMVAFSASQNVLHPAIAASISAIALLEVTAMTVGHADFRCRAASIGASAGRLSRQLLEVAALRLDQSKVHVVVPPGPGRVACAASPQLFLRGQW